MALFIHPFLLISLTVISHEIGFVRLAEIRHLQGQNGTELLPVPLSSETYQNKQKKLEISSFRKTEKTKEFSPRSNTTQSIGVKDILETGLYRLRSDNGLTCILLKVDAIVSFKYMTKLNEEQEVDSFIPTSASVTGECSDDEDKQRLVLKWKSFVLIWSFAKSPGGERWFVPKIELKYDSADPFFEHMKNPGRSYTLSSSGTHTTLLFPTPVGKSYRCEREIEVELTSPQTHTVASLYLRDFKLEPFIFKNDEFGPEYMCAATGSGTYRSETAPLIVGSMLAAACLLTISGYAIYRYFNIEKVQYDTME